MWHSRQRTALVRRRSRVQVPSSAPIFYPKSKNLLFFFSFRDSHQVVLVFRICDFISRMLTRGRSLRSAPSPVISSNHKPLKNPYFQALSRFFYFLKILIFFCSKNIRCQFGVLQVSKKLHKKRQVIPNRTTCLILSKTIKNCSRRYQQVSFYFLSQTNMISSEDNPSFT